MRLAQPFLMLERCPHSITYTENAAGILPCHLWNREARTGTRDRYTYYGWLLFRHLWEKRVAYCS